MNKYKNKIPRDDLKRFAKEIAKKLVSSDFKAGRVKDPTRCDEKQQRKVKDYCKQFFDRAAHKHKKSEEERKARKAKKGQSSSSKDPPSAMQSPAAVKTEYADDDEDIKMSDHELDDESKGTPADKTPSEASMSLKRKREELNIKNEDDTPRSPLKKPHINEVEDGSAEATPPPPPPPPPPDAPMDLVSNGEATEMVDDEDEDEQDVEMEIDHDDSRARPAANGSLQLAGK